MHAADPDPDLVSPGSGPLSVARGRDLSRATRRVAGVEAPAFVERTILVSTRGRGSPAFPSPGSA